jgi:apolipoprotein N-acyltransferase
LSARRRLALALALGAAAAAALPPTYLLPLLLVSFSALVWLLDGAKGPMERGLGVFAFAYGYFLAGLYWTGISFFVDAARFAPLLPLPVLGLPLLLAAFPALGALAAAWRWPDSPARVLLLALGWCAGEYARSHLFSGFPWNLVGYAWMFSDAVAQSASWFGIHGLSFLTLLAAAMPATLADRPAAPGRASLALVAAALLAIAGGGYFRLAGAETAHVPGVKLRLVQPSIDQRDKWRDDRRAANFDRHRQLSALAGRESVTHIVWPETAAPYLLDNDELRRQQLARLLPGDGAILVGAVRLSAPGQGTLRAWNSLHAIDRWGRVLASYDKRHLVPFGEYLPLRPLLSALGADKLAPGTVDFSPGVGPMLMSIEGLPPFRVLICYEGIFPGEIMPPGEARPQWLLNVTNDGWFGQSTGPYQHFAMTRLRAVEQGVPVVRAANTGISAIVDPYGRAIASLGLGASGVVDGPLPKALPGLTPYARFGDASLIGLLPFALALAWLAGRRGGTLGS